MSIVLTACLVITQAGLPAGPSKVTLDLRGKQIDVFTYKPETYDGGPMLMVLHGADRNADEYRDHARALGDRSGMLVVAPRFDSEQFGRGMYQQGGLYQDGKVAPRSRWTWSLIPEIADRLRRLEGRPGLPYDLIGHSAGGQFLVRLAAFVETGAARIVAANPGSELFPTRDLPYPYGFGGLPDELGDDDAIRRYLARPLTLYLGTKDVEHDADLDDSPGANRQGDCRYVRGKNAYRLAEEVARAHGWPFRWRLVEAPGVGHDHRAMFDAPACAEALSPQSVASPTP